MFSVIPPKKDVKLPMQRGISLVMWLSLISKYAKLG
uniref:Uncharacterized protein n=1 Tax=Rhizophora mucronata TaxID=61149 RepID=A0A2P2PSR7_RHIMU